MHLCEANHVVSSDWLLSKSYWHYNYKRQYNFFEAHMLLCVSRTRKTPWEAWDFLCSLASNSPFPWCIIGDFNDRLYISDKKGRNPHSQSLMDGFKKVIEDCSLIKINLSGVILLGRRAKAPMIGFVKDLIGRLPQVSSDTYSLSVLFQFSMLLF